MKRHPLILFFFLTISFSVSGQNLNGFWKGNLTMHGCFLDNNIELQINISDDFVRGDSYHYQDLNNYVKKKFTGTYNAALKKLLLQETTITTYHLPTRCVICIKKYDLEYSKTGNIETLNGNWAGAVDGTNATCAGGSIVLTRIKESAFKEIPEVKVDTGTIRLDFYDNGIVDGDSITVLVNKKVIVTHQLLSEKPVTMYVKIDPNNTFQEVEMVAENLGSIPPNTALLIITAGKMRYRLYLASTESKNAMVRFVYDPNEESDNSNLQ